ncbi:hypothetical protein [Paenibacillus sp. MSJ-34]|uniref:hypothetical protein n=1 Tax=Paenibacillus sp. MSJ-34 TaxID=2841529 RepID=UPI001C0FF47E|nr:hypothetical protein [Paenibacillus sp. MSJ-34]MBU5444573.1 hypothetical protein [Paenibacillus sp. MSJ-34]
MLSFVILIGCSNQRNVDHYSDSIIMDKENSRIILVQAKQMRKYLLTIEYAFTNYSNNTVGPLYFEFIFHDKLLVDYLGKENYSPDKRLNTPNTLHPNETFKSSVTLELSINNEEAFKVIQELLEENKNTVEIRLIRVDDERVLASDSIMQFSTKIEQ